MQERAWSCCLHTCLSPEDYPEGTPAHPHWKKSTSNKPEQTARLKGDSSTPWDAPATFPPRQGSPLAGAPPLTSPPACVSHWLIQNHSHLHKKHQKGLIQELGQALFIHSLCCQPDRERIRIKHAAAVSVWSWPARSHRWAESWSTWGLVQEGAKSWMSPKIASSDARDAAARAGNLRHCSSDSWVLCLDVSLRNGKARRILLHVPKYPTGWDRGTTSSNTSRVKKFLSSINVYLNPRTCKYTCRWSY